MDVEKRVISFSTSIINPHCCPMRHDYEFMTHDHLHISPVVVAEVNPVAHGEVRHGGERASVRGERLRCGGIRSRIVACVARSLEFKVCGCNLAAAEA